MKKVDKKSPWLGCLFYLALVSLAYFLTAWQVATSIAVLITAWMFLYGGIVHEIKKMRKLKNTPRMLISQTPPHGYVKLLAKVKPEKNSPLVKTYFTQEPADYHWISFQYANTAEESNAEGGTSSRTEWYTFYERTTHRKTIQIDDGTGTCYVALQNASWYVNRKVKQPKAREFLLFIQKHGIEDVPLDGIKKDQRFKIVERWIRKDQAFTLYGTMNKLALDQLPQDIIKNAKRVPKYGSENDTRSSDSSMILNENDWKSLINVAKKEGASTLDILTTDYTDTPENELVLNVKDNKAINRNSYIAIVVFVFSAVVVALVWYGFVNSQYPEFFEQFP